MPSFFGASQGTNTYLEIGQSGPASSLDAKESWTKFYIADGRVSDATIGIYRGGYGGSIDTANGSRGSNGQRFSDANAVRYDFYLAMDLSFTGVDENSVSEESPCLVRGQYQPSLTVYSGDMSVDGWYKIDAARFLNNARCNGATWEPTAKTGKYVLFMRASWDTPDAGGQGRINAFKAGAAYAHSSGTLDNPLTGYWADFTSAFTTTTPQNTPNRAAYSVQDRLSNPGTVGDYTFKFAPDCRLAQGEEERRYLHWKDVDYPAFYAGKAAPEFDLVEVSPGGTRRTVLHVDTSTTPYPYNGSNQNIHGYKAYDHFKGGYTYEWTWKNIVQQDGISFWIPYDDYPALNGGCGDWKHELGLKAGTTRSGLGENDFLVASGETVAINLKQVWSSDSSSAGPNTNLDLTVAAQDPNKRSIATAFSGVSATLNGSSVVQDAYTRIMRWTNLPRLGPQPTYASSRSDLYAYFTVANNAPDGAKYCASAVMSPKSSEEAGGTKSLPNQICFTIDNSLKPYLTTAGGDVHAGDCLYLTTGINSGKITGQPVNGVSQGSSGSYIVSAADSISDFGSGGSPSGTALTFGKGGYYGTMCRPLMTDVDPTKEKEVEVISGDATIGTFDLSKLTPGKRYAVTFAANGAVKGTARASVTVYAPNGTVTIESAGGSTFGSDTAGSYAKTNLPTVGVTAQNIKISNAVTGVTAALYASGTITTCAENSIAACRSALWLSGYAMAHDFRFNRTGSGSSGYQLSELISFNPAFYLNPHPGGGVEAGAVQYLGERAPLY